MAAIKRLLAVPVRFGGEEHSGWLPANAVTPQPTPVEDAHQAKVQHRATSFASTMWRVT